MSTVYSFTGAAILASIIFSLLLFLSIDNDPWMKFLLGSLAVIFELGKFFAWYEFGERRARKNYPGAFSAVAFYAVLAAISIGGSIGGINSATNSAQNHANVQQSKVNAYNQQIEAIDQQIALNNQAAEKYIEMERIATGVTRIQKENARLREQQQQLAMERDSLPVISQGSVLGLIDSLAQALNIKAQSAQLGLVIFLSILLDFFAAFFVGLISEELRFRKRFSQNQNVPFSDFTQVRPELITYQSEAANEASTPNFESRPEPDIEEVEVEIKVEVEDPIVTVEPEPVAPIIMPEPKPEPEPKTTYQQALEALSQKRVNCSKKAVAAYLKLNAEEVDLVFQEMLSNGIVRKKANHHFQWQGIKEESA